MASGSVYRSGCTVRHDEWKEWELQVLYDLYNVPEYLERAAAMLPGRTRITIMNRMSRLRKEAGYNTRAAQFGLEPRKHG